MHPKHSAAPAGLRATFSAHLKAIPKRFEETGKCVAVQKCRVLPSASGISKLLPMPRLRYSRFRCPKQPYRVYCRNDAQNHSNDMQKAYFPAGAIRHGVPLIPAKADDTLPPTPPARLRSRARFETANHCKTEAPNPPRSATVPVAPAHARFSDDLRRQTASAE